MKQEISILPDNTGNSWDCPLRGNDDVSDCNGLGNLCSKVSLGKCPENRFQEKDIWIEYCLQGGENCSYQ